MGEKSGSRSLFFAPQPFRLADLPASAGVLETAFFLVAFGDNRRHGQVPPMAVNGNPTTVRNAILGRKTS